LSVFAGTWTLEDAAVICEGQDMDYWAVVDGLDGLVNRSLVSMDETLEGAVHYRLLETVRQYAEERLAAADEEVQTRDRHLSYYLALAEQAMQAFFGPELGSWQDRLETEHDNVWAALGWARVRTRGEEGLRLAAALAPVWEIRGHTAEGRRLLEEMLAAFQASPSTRARALNAAGFLVMREGEYGVSLALYRESLALRRELGDARGMAVSLNNIGNVHVELGEYEQAQSAYAEALAHFRLVGDQAGIATAFNNQAVATRELGQYERAEELANESLALRREQGDRRGVAETINNLAQVASVQGRHERAATLFKEGLLLSRDVGDMIRLLEALEGLAWATAELGQPRLAVRQGGAAEAERVRLGLSQGVPDRGFGERAVQAMRAALGEETFAATWAEGRAMTLNDAVALALKSDSTG
ncbi:MAG: ATP-binding protein, partial [Rhodanobacteraceae bacterium]